MRYDQLVNIPALKAFVASRRNIQFADAATGVVLSRNFEAIDPEIFMVDYPELTMLNSGVQIDNTGGFAEYIKSLRVRALGEFKNSDDKASNKGIISLAGDSSSLHVMNREGASSWSDTEVKQAELQGINLVQDFLTAHSDIYQQEIDESGYVGVPDWTGSTGLLNHAGFTASASGTAAAAMTPKELYEALYGLVIAQWSAVSNAPKYMANRVAMPISVLNLTGGIYDTTSSKSVMQMLKENLPSVEFVGTIHAASVSGTSVTCAFSTNSQVMKLRIPQPLTIGEIIKTGSFDYKFDSKYRIAGLDILESVGGRILTGL